MTEKESNVQLDNECISSLQPTLDSEVEEIVEDIEKRPKSEQRAMIAHVVSQSLYKGPIPPAEMLKEYEKVLPGSADRIISMAERQQSHRHKLELTVIKSNSRDSKMGIIAGALLSFALIVIGGLGIVTGYPGIGAFLSVSSIATLAGIFVYGTRSNREEREEKNKDSREQLQEPDDKDTK